MLQYITFGFIFAAGIGPVNIETAKRGLTGKSLYGGDSGKLHQG